MTDLYRVFPYDKSAAPNDRGGALYVPDPADGRIANPELYGELYLAGSPNAAIAERFGRFARWRKEAFQPKNGLPFALAHYRLSTAARICDLDDVATLQAYGIVRPTDVTTPQRRISQSWARRIFKSRHWDGICWWSHYHPTYRVYGIWATGKLSVAETPIRLTSSSTEVTQTAREIIRQIIGT